MSFSDDAPGSAPGSACAPTLRIWSPEVEWPDPPPESAPGDEHRLSPAMTLREFYDRYVRPVILAARNARPRNLDAYAQSLRYWERFTGNPPLEAIDEYVCAEFVRKVSRLPGRDPARNVSPNTVRKHCTHLQRLLDLAGPKTRTNRQGKGLLIDPPYLERPPKREEEPIEGITLEELEQFLAAARHARRPRIPGLTPWRFWRALSLFLANVGTRIETTILLEWSMLQDDVLHIPAEIVKGNNAKRIRVNQAARDALLGVRTADRRIFPWPLRAKKMVYTLSDLQKVRRDILAQTEIPPARQKQLGFHSFRRRLATELARVNPMVATNQLGHVGSEVTRKNYVAGSVATAVLETLPQPNTTLPTDRQLLLF